MSGYVTLILISLWQDEGHAHIAVDYCKTNKERRVSLPIYISIEDSAGRTMYFIQRDKAKWSSGLVCVCLVTCACSRVCTILGCENI